MASGRIADICEMVMNGQTLREIAAHYAVSAATIINWATATPEGIEQYTRAREGAADLFESDIIEAAMKSSPESAPADRVKIDALKWVAARRAPKRYGEKTQLDHVSSDASMTPKPSLDVSKLSSAAIEELLNASQPNE